MLALADSSIRPHRFCRRAGRLYTFWGANPTRLLRTTRSICLSVHGAFWPKAAASSLYPLPLSRRTRVIRTVEALRSHFHEEVLARTPFATPFGLIDRTGRQWVVSDVDGTRATARQRALPQTDTLPTPHRRLETVCAPGYTGRKCGEVVRTRTVILQAHTHQLLGTFGNAGNGDYRGELKLALGVIRLYATQHGLAPASLLVRLDGLYGDAAPLLDVLTAHLSVIVRSRAYHLLDLEVVQKHLAHPQDQVSTLPSPAFTASDILDLYVHRGSFETALADEDREQEMDCWYSHTRFSPGICPDPRPVDARTFDWNWANSSLHLNCVRPSLPLLSRSKLPQRTTLKQRTPLHLRSHTVHRNGLAHRLRMVFLVQPLGRKPMEACGVLPITHFISRSVVPNAMGAYDSCMVMHCM